MLSAPYVEGELLIRYLSDLKGDFKADDRQTIHSMTGIMTLETDFIVPNLELIRLPYGAQMAQAIDYFQKLPGVLYVSPNYIVEIQAGIFPFWKRPRSPKPDPKFGDPYFYLSYGVDKVQAPKVWEKFTVGSRDIVVGVIDTGIDYRHEDLVGNLWKNPKEIPNNGLDDDQNGYIDDIYGWNFYNNTNDPFDDNQHGTHVSGIIGAVAGNRIGTIGMSPKVSLMACKFLGKDGRGTTSTAIRAIEYALKNGAKILNNSWGGPRFSQPLLDTIKAAERMGVLFIAAAGNYNRDLDEEPLYPASYDAVNIISVASSDSGDYKSVFSNYGRVSVDLAAPGSAIYSTLPNGGYGNLDGTSMATPHVSGAAALIWAYRQDLSLYDLKDLILKSVDPIDGMRDLTITGGRLNVYNALALALLMF
jgi:subtilisin family serine protease